MSLPELLTSHLDLCDELYRLTVEENRFLRQERRPPDEAARARKLALAARLDASLAAIRAQPLPPGMPNEYAYVLFVASNTFSPLHFSQSPSVKPGFAALNVMSNVAVPLLTE